MVIVWYGPTYTTGTVALGGPPGAAGLGDGMDKTRRAERIDKCLLSVSYKNNNSNINK